MLRVRAHDAARATDGFLYSATIWRIESETARRVVWKSEVADGPLAGQPLTQIWTGQFDVIARLGTIDEILIFVRKALHFSIWLDVPADAGSPTAGIDANARDGLHFHGNRFDNGIKGHVGNDRLVTGAGNDTLLGVRGNDLLDGGPGADRMRGGPGNDIYVVDNARDVISELRGQGVDLVRSAITFALPPNVENLILTGAAGLWGTGNGLANLLRGNAGANVLIGGPGDDTIAGGAGGDRLDGGSGRDWMVGGDGADTLIGGLGPDRLTGDAGDDVFVFRSVGQAGLGASRDLIRDFETRADRIDLAAIDADTLTAGDQAFTFIGGRAFSDKPGELRSRDGRVQGDIDGDGRADFEIEIGNGAVLRAGDFFL